MIKYYFELALRSFDWAAGSDPLDAATMAAIAAGVSTRRYASTQEPVPAAHRRRSTYRPTCPWVPTRPAVCACR